MLTHEADNDDAQDGRRHLADDAAESQDSSLVRECALPLVRIRALA
jgi:hypothetical protein